MCTVSAGMTQYALCSLRLSAGSLPVILWFGDFPFRSRREECHAHGGQLLLHRNEGLLACCTGVQQLVDCVRSIPLAKGCSWTTLSLSPRRLPCAPRPGSVGFVLHRLAHSGCCHVVNVSLTTLAQQPVSCAAEEGLPSFRSHSASVLYSFAVSMLNPVGVDSLGPCAQAHGRGGREGSCPQGHGTPTIRCTRARSWTNIFVTARGVMSTGTWPPMIRCI